jgi:hypothetical protein
MPAIMETLLIALGPALASGAVMAALVSAFLARRIETVRREVEERFSVVRSRREWKQAAVAQLLGPVVIQLDRTKRAYDRYRAKNLYLEAKVIREGNLAVRDLLLCSPHLIPPDLLDDAAALIEHYDRWLEEFERLRGGETPDLKATFVFVGPAGYPFPREAENRFRAVYSQIWNELYGRAA